MLNEVDCWHDSTHYENLIKQASQEAWYSVTNCSRGCYYGYGYGYVMERQISAHAHTQQFSTFSNPIIHLFSQNKICTSIIFYFRCRGHLHVPGVIANNGYAKCWRLNNMKARDKRLVEWLLKQTLNAFKLIQNHTAIQHVSPG